MTTGGVGERPTSGGAEEVRPRSTPAGAGEVGQKTAPAGVGGAGGSPAPPIESEPQKSSPYGFYVVMAALSILGVVFVLTMLIFRAKFGDAAAVTAALTSLFGIVGTVVGAYFGIKLSSDTTDKTQKSIDKANNRTEQANDTANKALGRLERQEAKEITG